MQCFLSRSHTPQWIMSIPKMISETSWELVDRNFGRLARASTMSLFEGVGKAVASVGEGANLVELSSKERWLDSFSQGGYHVQPPQQLSGCPFLHQCRDHRQCSLCAELRQDNLGKVYCWLSSSLSQGHCAWLGWISFHLLAKFHFLPPLHMHHKAVAQNFWLQIWSSREQSWKLTAMTVLSHIWRPLL